MLSCAFPLLCSCFPNDCLLVSLCFPNVCSNVFHVFAMFCSAPRLILFSWFQRVCYAFPMLSYPCSCVFLLFFRRLLCAFLFFVLCLSHVFPVLSYVFPICFPLYAFLMRVLCLSCASPMPTLCLYMISHDFLMMFLYL